MANRSCILAVDLGTSGPKVGLVTPEGEVLAYEFEATPVMLLPGGGAEQSADVWWDAITRATRRLLARQLAPIDSIAAMVCTGQWCGTVPVDRGGNALANALIWMDARGAPYVKSVIGGPLRIEGYAPNKLLTWMRLTGGAPTRSGKDPIAHILFLKHERPEIYRQTYKFLEPKDYLNLRLTGRFAASTESITMHWLTDNRDLAQVDYAPRLLALAGVERDKFPDLRRAVDILGPLQPQVERFDSFSRLVFNRRIGLHGRCHRRRGWRFCVAGLLQLLNMRAVVRVGACQGVYFCQGGIHVHQTIQKHNTAILDGPGDA